MMHSTYQLLVSTFLAQSEGGWSSGESATTSTTHTVDSSLPPSDMLFTALRDRLDFLCHPDMLKGLLLEVSAVWAAIFIVLGAMCVTNGFRWRKWIVVALAALAGMWIASQVATNVQGAPAMAASIAIITGVVAWPFMRYAAALFGGLAGAFAGANIWTAIGQAPEQYYVGALLGLIIVSMAALTAFRSVIIALTTIVGSTMLVLGGLAGLLQVGQWQSGVISSMESTPQLVPILVGSVLVIGAVLQFGGGLKGLNTMSDRAHAPIGKKPVEAKTT